MRARSVAFMVLAAVLAGTVAHAAPSDPLAVDALLADVARYAQLAPDHLSGTPAEAITQSWMKEGLDATGMRTGIDSYSFFGFHPRTVSFSVDGDRSYGNIAALYYSGTTGAQGITAPLVDGGYGTAIDAPASKIAGKIVVIDVPMIDDSLAVSFARAQVNVAAAGAAGAVYVTEGPRDLPVNQDVDSRGGVGKVPAIVMGKESGARVIAAAKAARTATLTLDAETDASCDTNVWGVLPGVDPDRYIVIGTPTSGFVPAASERGSGVALFLGLARTYAALPQAQRPVGLIFVALSGHEDGYLGLPTFMQMHEAWFAMTDAYVHLGASIGAVQQIEDSNGNVTRLPVGDATRALYVSENPAIEAVAAQAFARAAPVGSIPPGGFDPGEQGFAYHAGVPIVAMSGGSYYFHTAGDLPDGVDGGLLATIAAGFRGAIDGVAGLPRGVARNANVAAAQTGAQQQPSSTPGGAGGGAYAPQPVASCGDPRPLQPAATPSVLSSSIALGLVPGYEDLQPGFAWQGEWQSRDVTWPSSRNGAHLYGTVFAPTEPSSDRRPAVVMVPGSGPGVEYFYHWAARDLAGHGYVALVVDPQGVGRSETFGAPPCSIEVPDPSKPYPCEGVPFQQADNYVDAAESGIDFLVSGANPYAAITDATRIGAAGHSLGARAVSYAQGIDPRIDAVVAWDNLASDLNGDAGSPSGGPPAGTIIGGEVPGPPHPVTPRAPALGEANDKAGSSTPQNKDPDQKKTAFSVWRSSGVASMEVSFRGSGHLDWAQADSNGYSVEKELQNFEYYTRNWFDLFLKGDPDAKGRLRATAVNGTARNDVLSGTYRSAIYLPSDNVDCPDLSAC